MIRITKQICRIAFLLMACANVSWGQNLFITEFMAVRSIEVLDDDGVLNNSFQRILLEGPVG